MSNEERFKALLGENHIWPTEYPFKFIVKSEQVDEVRKVLNFSEEITLKESKNGKYTSVSANIIMESSDAVTRIYQEASLIDGIISL